MTKKNHVKGKKIKKYYFYLDGSSEDKKTHFFVFQKTSI